MNAEDYMPARIEQPIWYRSPDWSRECAICCRQIDRGEIIADAGPDQFVHQSCFEVFYEK